MFVNNINLIVIGLEIQYLIIKLNCLCIYKQCNLQNYRGKKNLTLFSYKKKRFIKRR